MVVQNMYQHEWYTLCTSMSIRPGMPVRGSRTGRPVMILLDLLGRRWALRILWELRGGALGFRELRAACDRLSPTILSRRLGEMSDLGIVAKDAAGRYRLSRRGPGRLRSPRPVHALGEGLARFVPP